MAAQEARVPRSSRRRSFKAGAAEYVTSLYTHGWSLWPLRCTCSWLGALGPSLLSGFFIPFSLVPTAMTCAVISGLPVSAALNSCWILSLITCLFGGAPGTVSAVTEAISTTLVSTVVEECSGTECTYTGREFIYPAAILCGLIQCLCGLKGLGRYVSLVPVASRLGYLNAVAIINCRSQMHAFSFDPLTSTGYEWLLVLGLILQVCLVMYLWPLVAPCKLSAYLPASAVALASSVATEFGLIRHVCHMRTKTVGDVSSLAGGGNLPVLFFRSPAYAPPTQLLLSFKGLYTLIEVALTLVLLSSISALMTLEKLQERSKWTFNADRQLAALGAANAVSSLLGCLPGTTGMMVSLLASRMGASSKEAPLFASAFLLIFTSAAYHVLDVIPLGGLSGAIVFTAVNAVSWDTLPPLLACFLPKALRGRFRCLQLRLSRTEAAVVILTTVLGVTFDLGSSVLIGMFISLCSFVWEATQALSVDCHLDPAADTMYYCVSGPLFFSSVRQLPRHFNAHAAPKRSVVLLPAAEAAAEHAVMMALADIGKQHEALGKEFTVYGIHLNGQALGLHAGRALEGKKEDILARMRGNT